LGWQLGVGVAAGIGCAGLAFVAALVCVVSTFATHLATKLAFGAGEKPSTYTEEEVTIWLRTRHGSQIPALHLKHGHPLTLLVSHSNFEDLGDVRAFWTAKSEELAVNVFAYEYSGYGAAPGHTRWARRPVTSLLWLIGGCTLALSLDVAWGRLRSPAPHEPEAPAGAASRALAGPLPLVSGGQCAHGVCCRWPAAADDTGGAAASQRQAALASTYLACSVCMYMPTGALVGAECAEHTCSAGQAPCVHTTTCL